MTEQQFLQDLLETNVALPVRLFANTQISAYIWILNKNKSQKGKTLFIDSGEVDHTLDRKQKYIWTFGCYVGVSEEEDDGAPFAEKMVTLTATLGEQFEESHRLESEMRINETTLGRMI